MARVVFIQSLGYEFHGTEVLSARLKERGHATDLVIDADPDPADPVFRGADILAFSVMTGYEGWALACGRKLKAATGAVVVFGGPHPTHCPEVVREPGVDVVCRGEGEDALAELADRIARREDYRDVANLWVKAGAEVHENPVRPPVADLDTLPPDRDLYYARYPFLAQAVHKPFMAGRGCPYACVFCSNEALRTLYGATALPVRLKSPEALVREIEGVRDRYGLRKVFFHDDTFVLRRQWLEDFLDLYETRVGLPFYCQSRADTLTEALAARLKRAGCRVVFFAIESGVESIRQETLGKALPDAKIIAAAKWLKDQGIGISTYNIVGIPGETVADALETIRLNIRIGADYPRCSFLTPYPGTRLLALARETGLLPAAGGIGPFSQQSELLLSNPDARVFKNIHALFQSAVLFPWAFPVVQRLVRLPLGFLYAPWWLLVYSFVLLRSEGRGMRASLQFLRFAARQWWRKRRW